MRRDSKSQGDSKNTARSKFTTRSIFSTAGSFREGVNREKLTVKKLIDKEMFFFSPFMSLTNRE